MGVLHLLPRPTDHFLSFSLSVRFSCPKRYQKYIGMLITHARAAVCTGRICLRSLRCVERFEAAALEMKDVRWVAVTCRQKNSGRDDVDELKTKPERGFGELERDMSPRPQLGANLYNIYSKREIKISRRQK